MAPLTESATLRQSLDLNALIEQLDRLRTDMLAQEQRFAPQIDLLPEATRASARNLIHYIALRRHDVRSLQESLAHLGLSSLGRAESHVLTNVATVLHALKTLAGHASPAEPVDVSYDDGHALLQRNTQAVLGAAPTGRSVRVMVTMPSEAATDYALVCNLVAGGMDCMRVNCAHDGPEAWTRMVEHLRRAERETGRHCKVLMDIAGPKLRTGAVAPGPSVRKWRPRRDTFGRILAPARVFLTPIEHPQTPPEPADACLPLPGAWLARLTPGAQIRFRDTRGARRTLQVTAACDTSRWAECRQTCYVAPGVSLHHVGHSEESAPPGTAAWGDVGPFPPADGSLLFHKGDTLVLTRSRDPGRPPQVDSAGRVIRPGTIPCTLPEVFADLKPGERILLDDGHIGGAITSVSPEEVWLQITQARPGGERLRADKGINLPDSRLRLHALTQKDLEDLPFIARHADLIGFSFVNSVEDVQELQTRLIEVGGERVGIVLKIETRRAFDQLPSLLLAAMRSPSAGVMIARGDLAVECGYERLAEAQEEILWICEAAHTPVIWATQVLESLTKLGVPSRAEITDAAMGERAECIMLNKGPYILDTVRTLNDILQRMQAHQSKKRSMLRRLHMAQLFCGDAGG